MRHARRGLQLRHPHRRVEGEVDVVAKEHVAGLRVAVEEREAVTTRARGEEKLAVVAEIESAAHSGSTSTSRSVAADSARSSASTFVSPTAIT